MPINENTAKTSIEFRYEHTSAEGESIGYDLQFSHTEAYGPTISILNSDGSLGAEVPADMFIDTVRYLASRNVIPWPRPTGGLVPSAADNKKHGKSRIAMPVVSNGMTEVSEQQSFDEYVNESVGRVADIAPLQSFSGVVAKKAAPKGGLAMPVVIAGLQGGNAADNDEPTAEEMMAERAAAKAKKTEKGKLKRVSDSE